MVMMPCAASAHSGHGDTSGFAQGFGHPLGGADHVLAMIAVGLFAARLGGQALWLLPLTFMSMMAVGGAAGMAGVGIPLAESGIALSVVVLGLAIAWRLRVPTSIAMACVGIFAVFHGYAHGAEVPDTVSGLLYGGGFICATALLHATGVGSGIAIAKAGEAVGRWIVQIGGAAMAVVGVAIFASS